MSRELLQLARDAMRALINGRHFGTGQTGYYLNIIRRIEDELAKPEHANPAAKHWHDLYRAKCKDFQDGQARLGAEIVALEEEIAELKEEQPEQKFYPDWDMLQPYHDRISELEAELDKREQEPVAWKYDWYGYKSQSETKVLVKDWIASVYSEVSDPTIGAHNIRPLYTTPPRKPWVSLSDDEVDACFADHGWSSSAMYYLVANALEFKLKQKNT
jgi:hypothetical protein